MATLLLRSCTKTVRRTSPNPPPHQHLAQIVPWGDQRNPARHWEYTVLCTCCQHHHPYGVKLNCKGTTSTMEKAKQLLDYLTTYPNAIIRFWASDMIINVHSDPSYLSELDARRKACGHFFMGWSPVNGNWLVFILFGTYLTKNLAFWYKSYGFVDLI